MGYKHNNGDGDIPRHGAIFMSNSGTKKECFERKLFGLPLAQSNFVLHVKKGMMLFLFEFERRQLHGVFRATSNGEIDIEPHAFRSSGKWFPAQVPFTSFWDCYPLAEHEFKGAIKDNYFSWKKFKFGLSKNQVHKLMNLFSSKRISKNDPPRPFLKYDDKPSKRDTRFGDNMIDNRKKVRDRIRFIKQEDGQGHGFDFDEVNEVDDQGYKTLKKKSSQKDNDDFSDFGSRKKEKRRDCSLRGLRRKSDASLPFMSDIKFESEMRENPRGINGIKNMDGFAMVEKVKGEHDIQDSYWRCGKKCGIANKNKYLRDDNHIRIQDEYHSINVSPNRGSQTNVDGLRHGIVKSQQRTWTDSDVCQNLNSEPRTSPFEPKVEDFGIKLGSDKEFDLRNVVSITHNSNFTPINDNIGNTYECGLPYSASSDPSMITMHTPYDPEAPDFCSYFAPERGSIFIDNIPISKDSDLGKSRSKNARKISVFDRLTSAPKPLIHEKEHEKSELDSLVNKVMENLEKIVTSPRKKTVKRQSTFEENDDDNLTASKIVVDYELPKMESESVFEETRVLDFKRRKNVNKNCDDEFKEGGEESDVGRSRKRRKLVRPVFVKKESTILKVDCYLTKEVESAEGQKGSIEGQVEENCKVLEEQLQEKHDSADMARVDSSKDDHEMCGRIEGEEVSLQVEESGNEEKLWQEKDGFDDMARVHSLKDDHKMCGWIEE